MCTTKHGAQLFIFVHISFPLLSLFHTYFLHINVDLLSSRAREVRAIENEEFPQHQGTLFLGV